MAVLSQLNLNNPQEISEAGERIYNEQYKAEYEPSRSTCTSSLPSTS
jgi:hypothetical protein